MKVPILTLYYFRINAIILAHFILDLRSIYHIDGDPTSNRKIATLQFAASVEGNMGTALTDTWISGRQRDVEEEQKIQYSDSPLGTGLVMSTAQDEDEGEDVT